MTILNLFLLFIIPANILLSFFIKVGFNKKIDKFFLLLISYSTAPLLSGLFFYYLIWLFPKNNAFFYIFLVFLFWLVMLFYSRKKIGETRVFYEDIIDKIKKANLNIKIIILGGVVFFFTILFSIQALFYPISENDSARYFLQSKMLHKSLDANWYSGKIINDDVNEYYYNDKISPGIPSVMAFLFLFGQKENNYFIFNFFFVWYYYLLVGMFLLVVSRLASSLKKDRQLAMLVAFAFFVFYWNMTRFYIFNNKEVVIYFLALAGIYLIHNLILAKKRDMKIELLLGIILGLNSFVNFHGIVIGIFLLCILFLFSKLSFLERTWQIVFIFCANLFFSAFEFFQSFSFIFLDTIKNMSHNITQTTEKSSQIKSQINPLEQISENSMASLHAKTYQINNLKDIYIKGKLQSITNIGSYGFYFLSFLFIIVSKLKEIKNSIFGKILLLFMIIYFFVIIDPLNLNKNDLAIVLWGSPKYNMLLVLFSIIIIATYFDSIVRAISRYIFKNKLFISGLVLTISGLMYIFKGAIINLGFKILTETIQINRDINFYISKIELFYYVILSLGILFGIFLIILYFMKVSEKNAYTLFFIWCLLFMISPFFVVSAGKVPLVETFTLLNKDREIKLQNTIYFGDIFKVYYYAKNNLPEKALIRSVFLEVYVYNDYFKMVEGDYPEAKYKIDKSCLSNQKMLYKSGAYCLCQDL